MYNNRILNFLIIYNITILQNSFLLPGFMQSRFRDNLWRAFRHPENFKVHTIDRSILEDTYETHAFSKVIVKVVTQTSKKVVKKYLFIYFIYFFYYLHTSLTNKDYIKIVIVIHVKFGRPVKKARLEERKK